MKLVPLFLLDAPLLYKSTLQYSVRDFTSCLSGLIWFFFLLFSGSFKHYGSLSGSHHSHHSHHSHSHVEDSNLHCHTKDKTRLSDVKVAQRKLTIASIVCLMFMIAEFVGKSTWKSQCLIVRNESQVKDIFLSILYRKRYHQFKSCHDFYKLRAQ